MEELELAEEFDVRAVNGTTKKPKISTTKKITTKKVTSPKTTKAKTPKTTTTGKTMKTTSTQIIWCLK